MRLYPLVLFALLPVLRLVAQPACVPSACGAPIEVGIPNGGFEDPPLAPPDGRITFFAGEIYSTWSIVGGSIDLLGPDYSNFQDGNPNGPSQFIDLNGFEAGTITTTLSGLMSGNTYVIVLWYAKNPGASSASCNIQVAGGAWLNANWTSTNNGGDVWLEKCFTFVAQGTTAELRFIGSSTFSTAGMLLDNMTMWKLPLDEEPPAAGNPPVSPLLLECDEPVPAPDDPQFTDNCPGDLDVTFTETTLPQTCFYNLTRTWVAEDQVGNTASVTQLIQVVDTQAPSFATLPADTVVGCNTNYLPAFFSWLNKKAGGVATDNCDLNVAWTHAYAQAPAGDCGIFPVTFTIRDDCGNTNTAEANFIVEDLTPPDLILEAQDKTVLCAANGSQQFTLWLLSRGGAVATDNCGLVTWTNNFSGSNNNPVIEVTFTATDECQNSVSTTATFYQPILIDTVFVQAYTCAPQQAGVVVTLAEQGNCDTYTITTTTYIPPDTTLLNRTTCDPAAAGTFIQHLNNLFGCDSTVIETVALLPRDTTLFFNATCLAANAGVFTQNLLNQYGCDSTVVTTVAFIPLDTTLLLSSTCDTAMAGLFVENLQTPGGCDSVVLRQVNLLPTDAVFLQSATCDPAAAGVFVQHLTNRFNCDSTVTTTINLLPRDTILLPGASCNPLDTGVFTQNLLNQFGCDSTVVRTVSLLPSDAIALQQTTCDPAMAGVFVQILANRFGCDSIVTTTVALLPRDTTLLTDATCNPAGVGIFTQNLTNAYGCDSTVITTVAFSLVDTTLLFTTSCNAAQAGVFSQNFTTAEGCDSLVIRTVTYAPLDTVFLQSSSCDLSQTGVFTDKLTTAGGCDSLVVRTVNLLPSNVSFLDETTCDPTQAGVFIQSLTNSFGCDSTVTRTVVLLPRDTVLLFDATCNPASVGVFTQHLTNKYGCDSTVITTVTFSLVDTTVLALTTCDPAQAGIFAQNFTTPEGCDSLVLRTVSLLPSNVLFLDETTCDPNQAGIFVQNLINSFGCDSIVTRTVTLLPTDTVLQTATTCDPAQAGTFIRIFQNQYGCDSVVLAQTALLPLPSVTIETSDYNGFGVSCAGAADGSAEALGAGGSPPLNYLWTGGMGTPLIAGLTPGDYAVTVTDAAGCTASAMAQLAVPPPLAVSFAVTQPDCFGQNVGEIFVETSGGTPPYRYSLDGQTFQNSNRFEGLSAGTYTARVEDANGCAQTEVLWVNAPLDVQVNLGDDLVLQQGDTALLRALVNVPIDSLVAVQWWATDSLACPDCLEQPVAPLVSSAYTVRVVAEGGCSDADTVQVLVDRQRRIYAPNAIAPAGAGANAAFTLFAKPGAVRAILLLRIYDRWGEALFERADFPPNDLNLGWNGRFRDREVNPGVYVWVAELEFADGTRELFSGDVAVMR